MQFRTDFGCKDMVADTPEARKEEPLFILPSSTLITNELRHIERKQNEA
jgi:hypothetical protein